MVEEWTLLIIATVVMSVAMCAVGFFIERPKSREQGRALDRRNSHLRD